MSDNIVRSAIGAALDHPFAEEGFALVDLIEANVRDGEKGGESVRSPSVRYWGSLHRVSMRLHEVAAEITDRIVSVMSTRALANLWAILGADGEGDDIYAPTAPTLDRIRVDLFVVVERAVFAGLEAYAAESSATCRHCGRSIILDGDRWVDPEATGDDSVWRETCDGHDTFEAEHEPEGDR